MVVLLLGGPAHGQERELENGQTELTIMAPSPGNPLPTPWKYEVKTIQAETKPGWVFEKTVLVEKSMPVDVATEALTQVLLIKFGSELVRQFMETGTIVESPWQMLGGEENDTDSTNSESQSPLLIAKR